MLDLRSGLHLVLHVAVPGVAARLGWPDRLFRAWTIMLATMVVDLDHLLADPIYEPCRCSIGFHPLHGPVAATFYVAFAAVRRTRPVGVGLLIHLALDLLDCVLMRGIPGTCGTGG